MTSSPPLTTSEDQGPPARDPWWRQWLEPVVAGAIITALVIALVSVGVAGFQSLKGDMRDMETRLTQKIEAVKMDAIATETRLTKAIAASEARQREDLKDFKAETKENLNNFKAEIKADLKDFKAETKADLNNFKVEIKADLNNFKAEIKADNKALNDKLDRVLESLPATKD